jgi:predicted dehydrogenase
VPDAHDYRGDWLPVPDNDVFENGFKMQWEQFVRHVAEDGPHPYDFRSGARGVRLAEAGLESSATGRRIAIDAEVTAR